MPHPRKAIRFIYTVRCANTLIPPMCKVKFTQVVWYAVRIQTSLLFVVPVQVGPQVSNPEYAIGLTDLPTWLQADQHSQISVAMPQTGFANLSN
jgi:hypothetical protein